MSTTFAQITAREFEQLPETDRKLELNNGVVIEIEAQRAEHELVKIKLNMLLVAAILESEFVVSPGIMCSLGDRITRVPDVAIWRATDLENMDPNRRIVGGPLIAIEIISSETAEDLDEKIQQYFAAGTKTVWAIYPKTRSITVEHPVSSTGLGLGDALQAPELIPGLSIPVTSIFGLLHKH